MLLYCLREENVTKVTVKGDKVKCKYERTEKLMTEGTKRVEARE